MGEKSVVTRPVPVMKPLIPDFDGAVHRLLRFVADLGHRPRRLEWIFREDVSTCRRRLLIKLPLPKDNEEIARRLYEEGRKVGLGVCLEALCLSDFTLCCTTWFPEDAEDASYRMCSGLKLSIYADLEDRPVHLVRNGLVWRVRCWLDRRSGLGHLREFMTSRLWP